LEKGYAQSFRVLPNVGAEQVIAQTDGTMICTVEPGKRKGKRPRDWKEMRLVAATTDPHDPAKWHTDQGVLSLTGPKFMNWNHGVGGGGAIDLVMHLRQLSFGQALECLLVSD